MINLLKRHYEIQKSIAEARQAIRASYGRELEIVPSEGTGLTINTQDGETSLTVSDTAVEWLYRQFARILGHDDQLNLIKNALHTYLEAVDELASAPRGAIGCDRDKLASAVGEARESLEALL